MTSSMWFSAVRVIVSTFFAAKRLDVGSEIRAYAFTAFGREPKFLIIILLVILILFSPSFAVVCVVNHGTDRIIAEKRINANPRRPSV